MATVRFSDKLRDDIVNAAKNKFQNAVNTATNNKPDATVWGERLWSLFYSRYESTLASVPQQFVRKASGFKLGVIHLATGEEVTVEMDFRFTSEKPWPEATVLGTGILKGTNTWREVWNIGLDMSGDPVVQELVTLIKTRQAAINEAVKRRDEFTASVKQVINAHSTLAPALKLWPPLWDLLSEDVKAKHREVTERSAKATAETVGVDLNRLTALASLSKMGGA